MNYFDILLAKKMAGSTPLPANAYLLEEITDGDLTSAKSKPLPSVSVAVTDADELDVFVGDSESVTSDNEPYIYRQSKGGRMVSERLVGASVAWNQLVENGNFESASGWNGNSGIFSVANNKGTLEGNGATGVSLSRNFEVINNHIYLFEFDITSSEATTSTGIRLYKSGEIDISSSSNTLSVNAKKRITAILKATAYSSAAMYIYPNKSISYSGTAEFENFNAHDLTLMFGSTIADYVYSLEQSEAGSGIAWLKSYGFFSEDYYAYDSGSLKSVSASEKKVRDASDNVIATYPLPSSDLRGLYKLASNKLYCDGDIQHGDGWRLRRYGIVDLGTLEWAKQDHVSLGTYFYGNAVSLGIKPTGDYSQNVANAICSNYKATRRYATVFTNGTLCYDGPATSVTQIQIKDDNYSDATSFKTAMSGVYLIYELATPAWEKTHPFANPQTVGSTEEFVANLPVGHESKYYDGDIHHSYIYSGDARAKVTGDVDIVNGTAPNGTCSVCVVMPDGDEIWSDAGDVTAEIWT